MTKISINLEDIENLDSPLYYKDGNKVYQIWVKSKASQILFQNGKNAEEVVNVINGAVSTAQSTANTASTKADAAQTTATTAQNAASAAQTTANAAQTAATSAQTTANSASTKADTAISTANTANSTANTAKTTAESAATTASSASTAASNAVSTANTANTNATAAAGDAATAKSTADTAKTTADSALSKANQAIAAAVQMTGATATQAGTEGLAPAPGAGAANRYLRSDGTWAVPPDNNTTYEVATPTTDGLMSAEDKTKLDGLSASGSGLPESGILPIANGGTGADSAAGALSNLGGVAKTGDEMTGQLKITVEDAPLIGKLSSVDLNDAPSASSFPVFSDLYDKNNTPVLRNQLGYYPNSSIGNTIENRIIAFNRNSSGSLIWSCIGSRVQGDGIKYAVCDHPRSDNYGTDIVTMKTLKDYALEKTPYTGLYIYVNTDSPAASDTADLNANRGLTLDKPFKTLNSAINWVISRFSSRIIYIILCGDAELSGDFFLNQSLYAVVIQSDSTKRNITTTGIVLRSGALVFNNVKFTANSPIVAFLHSYGTYARSIIRLTRSCEFSGEVTAGTVACGSNGQITIDVGGTAFAGSSVTGPRYTISNGGKIFTQGLGENAFPGTSAGTKDSTSIYK